MIDLQETKSRYTGAWSSG